MSDEKISPKEEAKKQPRASYDSLSDELVLQIADKLGNELGGLHSLASLRATNRRNYRISQEVAEKAGLSKDNPIGSARLTIAARHLHKSVLEKELAVDQPDWSRVVQQVSPTLKDQTDQTKKEFVQSISRVSDRSGRMAAFAELAPYQEGLYPHAKKLLDEAVSVFCERQPSDQEFVETTKDEMNAAWFIAHGDRFLDKTDRDSLDAATDVQHQEWDERGLWLEYAEADARGDDLSGLNNESRERVLAERWREERLSRRSPEKLENGVRYALKASDPERKTRLLGEVGRSIARQLDRRRELQEANRSRSIGGRD